jgi:hypothetical protein
MTKLKLFGSETLEMTKDIPSEPQPKSLKKKKATINLSYGTWGTDIPERNIVNGNRPISVQFDGFNEGSSCGYNTEQEAQAEVERIQAQYSEKYDIKIIDERDIREKYNVLLFKWRDFIVNLCKEKGQEIDKIWFDKSSPYDCAVHVRMKEHKCYYDCVSFRFSHNKLVAYDSHFGHGTTFLFDREQKEQQDIKEVMEKVFNKDCSNVEWCTLLKKDGEAGERLDNYEHREIIVDEQGWVKDVQS